MDVWLDSIAKDVPPDILTAGVVDGKPNYHTQGSIYRICEASAILCNILESEALDVEGLRKVQERQRVDPKNRPEQLEIIEINPHPPHEAQLIEAEARSTIATRIETKPKFNFAKPSEIAPNEPLDQIPAQRVSLLTAFKAKGRLRGIKITDKMIAMAAKPGKWNDRTMVAWWKRNDARCQPRHDKLIRAVLCRDPSTIWS